MAVDNETGWIICPSCADAFHVARLHVCPEAGSAGGVDTRAQGLLWELARSKRVMFTEDGKQVLIAVHADLLDRIDDYIGYDEMGD